MPFRGIDGLNQNNINNQNNPPVIGNRNIIKLNISKKNITTEKKNQIDGINSKNYISVNQNKDIEMKDGTK